MAQEGGVQDDLRQRVSAAILEHAGTIAADAARFLPLVGDEQVDATLADRFSGLLTSLLSRSVRDGRIDPLSDLVTDLHRLTHGRSLSMAPLFSFAYLVERASLDELSVHPALGATMEPWPQAAALVRRASFDVLAAVAERSRLEPSAASLFDPVTALFSRPVFDAVLARQLDQAGRLGQSVSLMLFDVDDWPNLTKVLGQGVGDKLLERLGILIRGFFRQSDWIARYSDRTFAALLVGTDAADARALADRVRRTVADRLEVTDHRTNLPIKVTVSASVVNREVPPGEFVDAERLAAEAEAALRA